MMNQPTQWLYEQITRNPWVDLLAREMLKNQEIINDHERFCAYFSDTIEGIAYCIPADEHGCDLEHLTGTADPCEQVRQVETNKLAEQLRRELLGV